MNVVEFIRKFGWDNSKECLKGIEDKDFHFVGMCGEFVDWRELKRYIDAYGLVESYGGVDGAQKEAHKNCFVFNAPLLKAITLVEEI